MAHSFASGASVLLSKDHIDTVLKVMRDWEKAKTGRTAPSEFNAGDLTLLRRSRVFPMYQRYSNLTAYLWPALAILGSAIVGAMFIPWALLRMAGWI